MPTFDWDDEQSVTDIFVEAVYDGDAPLLARAGSTLIQERFEGVFSGGTSVDDGTLLRSEDLPERPDDQPQGEAGIELLEGQVSAERLEMLLNGALPTAEEVALWHARFGESLFNGEHDYDVYQSWGVDRVVHTDGREAYLAFIGGGYSFTEPWNEFAAGARTGSEALAALRVRGFTDVEDFRARWNRES